jgi:hypothetical protein
MSFLNVKNVKHLAIAKDVARTANASIDQDSADYIAEGELVVTAPDGTVLDTTSVLAADEIVIRQGRGSELDVISDTITKSSLRKYLKKAAIASQEEIWTLGFDGTTGAFDVINDNLYLLNIDMNESSVFGFGQDRVKYGVFKSDASATEEEIATGLMESLIANFSREPEQDILFELLNGGASAAVAPTANLVKNSDQVTFSAAHGLNAGDYIRVGAATTDAVYRIKAVVDASTVLLDVAYQGASNTAAVVESIDSATAQAAAYGIRFTGIAREFEVGKLHYQKVRFDLLPKDFGVTPALKVQGALEGSGQYEQIAELEHATQGNEGNYYRSRANGPLDPKRADAVAGTSYDMFTLVYEKSTHGGIGARDVSPKELVIALPTGYSGTSLTGDVTALEDVLDAFAS